MIRRPPSPTRTDTLFPYRTPVRSAKEPTAEARAMADNSIPADIRAMSFELALDELKAIVSKLEQGQGTLDSAIGDYDRGAALKRHCDAKLREAQARSEEHTSELQSLMRISYAAFCLKKKMQHR